MINYGKNNEYQIQFKDSYLILLKSLNELSQAFKVDNGKSVFPHKFINKNNFNYIGEVPDIKYFFKINKIDYQNYKIKFKGL